MPTKTLQIPTTDGQADAFAAFPDHGERRPGVLMYADGFGIRPVLREMARELAGHGYYVLVPNLFYRHGPAPLIELPDRIGEEVRPALMAQLMPLIEAHTAERVLRDADAYLRFLTTQPEVAAGPVAVTGYCIGGLLAMRTAAAHPGQVAAVAAFHGPVGADGPDTLAEITAQVHFGHAESDLTPEALGELNRTLEAAKINYTSEIYPGTVHGFTMSDTDAFDPAGLQRHWDRLLPSSTAHWPTAEAPARKPNLKYTAATSRRLGGPHRCRHGRPARPPNAGWPTSRPTSSGSFRLARRNCSPSPPGRPRCPVSDDLVPGDACDLQRPEEPRRCDAGNLSGSGPGRTVARCRLS